MEKTWDIYTINENKTILDALRKLNELSGVATTIFAVNSQMKVMGTITDGDLRRSLIAGKSIDTPLHEVMHRSFKYLSGEKVSVTDVKNLRRKKIILIPHLNEDGTIKDIYDFSVFHSVLPLDPVLMAGGKG